jgi:transposase
MRRQNDKWFVGLDDGSDMTVTSDDLLDRNKFEVAKITTTLSGKDKEKYSKQQKREANRLDGDNEKQASRVAHERRNEMKKNLFRDLNERIRTGKALDYGEFLNMSELLERPYKTTVGSFEFAVGGASSEACL